MNVNDLIDANKTQINGVVTNFNKIWKFSKISDSLNKADLAKLP
jgi:phospholipid/cholesterol/gamma-HCH transport system substrate-binding protein